MELLTLKEFERRWKLVSESCPLDGGALWSNRGHGHLATNEGSDPFDCRSLAVPPAYELVDRVADRFVVEWKELDERKIAAEVAVGDDASTTEDAADASETNKDEEPPQKVRRTEKTLPKWYEKHVRLPEQFDYASRLADPPSDDYGTGDRVLALDDPTKTTSYHQELWKLFREISTVEQLEKSAVDGTGLPRMEQIYREITEGTKLHRRLDAHALSRLRMNDRHELPPQNNSGQESTMVSSIRFECWKRQTTRGVAPDPSRMVLEFLGTQTLLDFHWSIVELAGDELWKKHERTHKNSSGFFFIEGVFYSTGTVDYVTPVRQWLQSGSKVKQRKRADHIGLSSVDNLPVKEMAAVQLQDISLRLGFRYVHVHHGDVECSVFATDRRLGQKASIPYPIIHDIWTQSYSIPDCEVCQNSPACIATSTRCELTDGRHRALCEPCARELRLQSRARGDIEEYVVWRGQTDLSAGACSDRRF